jgi:hypothetical protein
MAKFKEVQAGVLTISGFESEVGYNLLRVAESNDGDVMTVCLNEEANTYEVTIEGSNYSQEVGLTLEAANQKFDSNLG